MKLAKFLAEYLANGIDRLHKAGMPMDFDAESLQEIIQAGIEAFASTENIKGLLIGEDGEQTVNPEILISVEGGVVQVDERPEGIKIMCHDYDMAESGNDLIEFDDDGDYGIFEL